MQFDFNKYLPHLSIDCVIFGFQQKELKVLISKFKFGNAWTLPGGYILKTESVDAAASRILKERTNLKDIYLEQFRVFGDERRIAMDKIKPVIKRELSKYDKHRFTRETIEWMTSRFVCVGYYALVDIAKVKPKTGELDERLEWRSIADLPDMTYDHNKIVASALNSLRDSLDMKLTGFNLLPETFTMKELQQLYETVYERPFANNNFQKKMLDLNVLQRLEKKYTGAQNKAPYLYKFKKQSSRTK